MFVGEEDDGKRREYYSCLMLGVRVPDKIKGGEEGGMGEHVNPFFLSFN